MITKNMRNDFRKFLFYAIGKMIYYRLPSSRYKIIDKEMSRVIIVIAEENKRFV